MNVHSTRSIVMAGLVSTVVRNVMVLDMDATAMGDLYMTLRKEVRVAAVVSVLDNVAAHTVTLTQDCFDFKLKDTQGGGSIVVQVNGTQFVSPPYRRIFKWVEGTDAGARWF